MARYLSNGLSGGINGIVMLLIGSMANLPSVHADDFAQLTERAAESGRVTVLAGEWQPITGEIRPEDLESAITGTADREKEIASLLSHVEKFGGDARALRQYRYLPVAAYSVDAKGLAALRDYSENMRVWSDVPMGVSLTDSVPMISAPAFWASHGEGHGQTIAVLDAGVDAGHRFFGGRVIREACFTRKACPNGGDSMYGAGAAQTDNKHGTHVAGIAAGSEPGLRGVAPKASIIALKVLKEDGMGHASDILAGLDYLMHLVLNEGVSLAAVNLSLGASEGSNSLCADNPFEAFARLFRAKGIILVSASGNAGKENFLSLPACAPSIVSVGAVDDHYAVAEFSNWSPYLDFFAPGVQIMSSADMRGYWYLSGTSMAAPHVSGAIALIRGRSPEMTVDQLLASLRSNRLVGNTGIPMVELPGPGQKPSTSEKSPPVLDPIITPKPKPVPKKTETGTMPVDGGLSSDQDGVTAIIQ
ncbi:S8 family peptidase [Aestuariispira insulae]|uniref:Subtilase family protein n=1 Tax=Aestuariispira insulae TaxID=1461337 RepID=A0A3D9HWV9_9PROT|nr:S8 family serine peptidase [Aestuariispira insulae]RED53992.1 subtilase family protein [Aestuariispira insulae]